MPLALVQNISPFNAYSKNSGYMRNGIPQIENKANPQSS